MVSLVAAVLLLYNYFSFILYYNSYYNKITIMPVINKYKYIIYLLLLLLLLLHHIIKIPSIFITIYIILMNVVCEIII